MLDSLAMHHVIFTTNLPAVTDVLGYGRIEEPYVRHVVYISGDWGRVAADDIYW